MFAWGSTFNGELGLGGIEEENIITPTRLKYSIVETIEDVACGKNHTILLTNHGEAYSCGNNDHGQLGHGSSCRRPERIDALSAFTITKASCGEDHSLAINEWGQIFSWGSDLYGQLGTGVGTASQETPKVIKSLAPFNVIQITCGNYHSLALTNSGQLFSWGRNNHGQLGLGTRQEIVSKPTIVSSLAGIPFAFIASGGNHSFAVSCSGAVFGWGKNEFGQLGLNDNVNKFYPSQLKTLRSIKIKFITCGEDFSVFLTEDGGVFTCGAGMYGQLGHGSTGNETLPRKVSELMGSTVTQISCGRNHTLALVPSRGRIYAFGLGGGGQLGTKTALSTSTPQVVQGPWVDYSSALYPAKKEDLLLLVKKIFAGGDHCFAIVINREVGISPDDYRQYSPKSQILSIQIQIVNECAMISDEETVNQDLITYIETVFSNQACINCSFLLPNNEHYCCTSKNHGIDMDTAEKVFEIIANLRKNSLKTIIFECLRENLFPALSSSPPDVESLRLYITLIFYHEFNDPSKYIILHNPYGEKLLSLTALASKILGIWLRMCSKEYFTRLICIFKSVVSHVLEKYPQDFQRDSVVWDPSMGIALKVLGKLNNLNHHESKLKVSYDTFYLPGLSEKVNLKFDYLNWYFHNSVGDKIYFCNYPFLFDAPAKTLLLQTDQTLQMRTAMNQAAQQAFSNMIFMISNPSISTFLELNVSRESLVSDTINELSKYDTKQLKKPLKVKFVGEEAEDAGGVTKEFFMLLLKEILDPKYGMFKYFDGSRTIWFNEDSYEDERNYYLIGLLCGLAIYNFTIIDLPFPLALYKKLLKEPVSLEDFAELAPTEARTLQELLDYEQDDVETTYVLTFSIMKNVFDTHTIIELKPDGSNIVVTKYNKKEFVDLYVDFYLNKAVEKHFNSFHNGFHKVCGGKVLELFHAHELMALVVGNENYDWEEFQRNAKYKNGYTAEDETIKLFWEVFHELPLEEKKKFLLFLTGSDRIPILGMKAIEIYIQPTTDDKYLPVAHTCFNLLDLPRYKTKEKLRYKLLQSIQQNLGFSLV